MYLLLETWYIIIKPVLVVAQIYSPVTGQHQTLIVGRFAYFSLHWLLCSWRNLHLLKSFHRFSVSIDFFEFFPNEFAACSKTSSKDNHRKPSDPRTFCDDYLWSGLKPDHAIRVVVKMPRLSIRPLSFLGFNFQIPLFMRLSFKNLKYVL